MKMLVLIHTTTSYFITTQCKLQCMSIYPFACVHIGNNYVLVLQGRSPPAQVAACDDHHECKFGVFSQVDGRKTPPAQVVQCQDHLGHKYIVAGCSNKMQLAQGHHFIINADLDLVL